MAQQQAVHKFVLGNKELEGKVAEFQYDKGWYSITDIVGEERNVIYKSRNAQEAYMKWNVYIGRKKERAIPDDRRKANQEKNEQGNRPQRENHENRGIAAALNQIMAQAERMGYSHVLTLDDDSRCDAGLVRVLKHCLRYPKAGMICPDAVQDDKPYDQEKQANADDNATGLDTCCKISHMNDVSHHVSLAEDCITAGSLVSVAAWRESGGFDEKMFIDFVDMDFCATLREHGYRIYHVSNIAVHQRYGNVSKSFRIFGKEFYLFNYPPARIYYSVRNQIYFIRKHRGRHSIRISARLLFLFGYIGKHLVFENNRAACAKAILQGCKEGVLMRTDT